MLYTSQQLKENAHKEREETITLRKVMLEERVALKGETHNGEIIS